MRTAAIAFAFGCIGLFLIYRSAPSAPFPPGLIRATVIGSCFFLALLVVFFLVHLVMPRRVTVDATGIRNTGPPEESYDSATILTAVVQPFDEGRYMLSICYRNRRGDSSVRNIGLSKSTDPVELERLLLTLGWPMPETNNA